MASEDTTTPRLSPRSRRNSRPLPFTGFTHAMPTPGKPNVFDSTTMFDPSFSNGPSRPASPGFCRSVVYDVHQTLYGSRTKEREEVCDLVYTAYDSAAVFENPLTLARGQQQIADLFCLLGVLPGQMWSEMGDIAESQSYDGNRLVVMTHTLHNAFLPFLDPNAAQSTSTPHLNRSHSLYSIPGTPHPQIDTSPQTPVEPGFPRSMTHPADRESRWPISSLLGMLKPRSIASALTTIHLKIHTRLVFNELGKIIQHEDTWGLKETIEGLVPVLGHLYALERTGVAFLASFASRSLFRKTRDVHSEEEGRVLSPYDPTRGVGSEFFLGSATTDRGGSGGRNGYSLGSPLMMRKGSLSNASSGRRANGLGLEGDLALRFAEQGYVPMRDQDEERPPVTTMIDDD